MDLSSSGGRISNQSRSEAAEVQFMLVIDSEALVNKPFFGERISEIKR
jgi:hypothetical protein